MNATLPTSGSERVGSASRACSWSQWGRIAAIGFVLVLGKTAAALGQDTAPLSKESERKELGVSVSMTPEYTAGTFGTRKTTEVLYVPLLVEWDMTDRFDVALTIPYIWQHGQGVLSTLGVGPVRARARRGRLTAAARTTTEEGLGDILLEGDYRLADEWPLIPELTGIVEIKFPTADDRKGLGTGEFDELLGLDLRKRLSERWTTLLDLSYTFVGSPRGIPLQNSFGWSLGASYRVTSALRLSAYLEGEMAIARGEEDPLEVRVTVVYDLTRSIRLTGSVTKGLSDGSPDFGVSAGLGFRF